MSQGYQPGMPVVLSRHNCTVVARQH